MFLVDKATITPDIAWRCYAGQCFGCVDALQCCSPSMKIRRKARLHTTQWIVNRCFGSLKGLSQPA